MQSNETKIERLTQQRDEARKRLKRIETALRKEAKTARKDAEEIRARCGEEGLADTVEDFADRLEKVLG